MPPSNPIPSAKQLYITEQHISALQMWTSRGLPIAGICYYLCSIMDWFAANQYFWEFQGYRLIATIVFVLTYFINKANRNLFLQQIVVFIASQVSAWTIQAMIMKLGGHSSTYYAGMNLIIIAGLVFVPIGRAFGIAIAVGVYSAYLIPIFLFDNITDVATFVTNNVFIICTMFFAIVSRFLAYDSMVREFGLQYDLFQERNNLEIQVQDRTRELNKSEKWHRSLFESATDAIFVLDKEGIITSANSQACALFEMQTSELVGIKYAKLAHKDNEYVEQQIAEILSGAAKVFESSHFDKQNILVHTETSAKLIVVDDSMIIQMFVRNISEKRAIQEKLMESQKMDSIGTLAGGIAHDFRNVITAVLGFIELLRSGKMPTEKLINRCDIIEKSVKNAGSMVSQLLGFARKQEYTLTAIDPNTMLQNCSKLFELILNKKITIELNLKDNVGLIEGDQNYLENVVMNVLTNAKDAIVSPNGRIAISTDMLSLEDSSQVLPSGMAPGNYVRLIFDDNGIGIEPDIQKKIFEPFFTTKSRGKGTGLGLSMVYGVVSNMKGFITVESQVGKGTKFIIYFPECDQAKAICSEPSRAIVMGKGETILVVDDDEAVLSFSTDTLELHGYNVISTTDPTKAIQIFSERHPSIDLVITDVVMPVLDGVELVRLMKLLNPEVNYLMVSAYTKFVHDNENIDNMRVLQKPFESAELLSAVRRSFDVRIPSAVN